MKAILLRVGMDLGTDGALGPICADGTFEYIPLSERNPEDTSEIRTYVTIVGRTGRPLSDFLPPVIARRVPHADPDFFGCTYGDTRKRNYLLSLQHGDLLVFYAGLVPFGSAALPRGLYLIGYFTVDKVADFRSFDDDEILQHVKRYPGNAHLKRIRIEKDLVLVIGDRLRSTLLPRAILISEPRPDKRGRSYLAVSAKCEACLGISGSIQRSVPPRFIRDEPHMKNLKRILGIRRS